MDRVLIFFAIVTVGYKVGNPMSWRGDNGQGLVSPAGMCLRKSCVGTQELNYNL